MTAALPRPRWHRWARLALFALVALALLLVLAVAGLRVWLARSPDVAPAVVARVERLTGLEFGFERIDARLGRWGPELVFRQAHIAVPGQGEPLVTAASGRVGFDWWRLLRTGRLRSGRLVLEGAELRLDVTERGVELRGQDALPRPDGPRLPLAQLPVGQVRIERSTVEVHDLRGPPRSWRLEDVDLDLQRDPESLRVQGRVRLPRAVGTRADFDARLDGPLDRADALDWRARLDLHDTELGALVPLLPAADAVLRAGRGDLRLDLRGRGRTLAAAETRLALRRVRLGPPEEDATAAAPAAALPAMPAAPAAPPAAAPAAAQFATVAGILTLQRGPGAWRVTGRNIELDAGGEAWRRGEIDLEIGLDGGDLQSLRVRSPSIRLDPFAAFAPALPAGRGAEALAALAPRGLLTPVDVVLERGAAPGEWRVDGRVRFAGLAIREWGAVPGVAGLNGELVGRGTEGRVLVQSSGFALALPRYLRAPVAAQSASANLDWWWRADGWRLATDDLRVVASDVRGGGRARLWLPADGEESPRLVLDLRVADVDLRGLPKYLPAQRMPAGAMQWLDAALLAGRVPEATLEYAGELRRFPFRHGGGVFRIRGPFEGLRLHYRDGWRDLEDVAGEVEFRNEGWSASVRQARVAGLEVTGGRAAMRDYADARLEASASVRGDVRDGLAFLKEAPLGPGLGPTFMALEARGPATAELALDLPFRGIAERVVQVDARLERVAAQVPGLEEELRGIAGSFRIRNRDIEVPLVTGTGLGGVFRVRGTTRETRPGERLLALDLEGRSSGERLQPVLGITEGSWLEGTFDWRAEVRLPRFEWRPAPLPLPRDAPPGAVPVPREMQVLHLPGQIRVESTLAGLGVGLPPPLAKAAEATRPLRLELAIDPGVAEGAPLPPRASRRHREPRAPLLRAHVQLGREAALAEFRREGTRWALDRGTVRLGGGTPQLRETEGVWLEGTTPQLDLSAWLAAKLTGGTGRGVHGWLRGGRLEVGRFALFGFGFPDLALTLEGSDGAWRARIDGPSARGLVVVPWELPDSGPLELDLDRLVLGERTLRSREEEEALDPTRMPGIRIAVRNLEVQRRRFGSLEAELVRRFDGLALESATLRGASFEATAEGGWTAVPQGSETRLSLELRSTDVLDTLSAWGFAPTLAGRAARLSARLRWPGAPTGDVLGRLGGTASLAVDDGQLLNVQPGAGRVLGLLSVAALPRRLSLDFTDLTEKGFVFDGITGDFEFRDGSAFTTNLVMKGPAAAIGIVGRTGLVARDYDQTAMVTGDFGGPLAAAGALAGGPAVGAALLLFSRVFKEPLSGMTRAYYRVTGPWDAPRVERIGAAVARETQENAENVPAPPSPPSPPSGGPGS